jgi:hypothetical protein
MNWYMVGTPNIHEARSRSIASSVAAGSKAPETMCVPPSSVVAFSSVVPPEWYIGVRCR